MQLDTFSERKFSLSFWLIIIATINAASMTALSLTLGNWNVSLIGKLYFIAATATQFIFINYAIALLLYPIFYLINSQQWRIRICAVIFTLAQLFIITNLKVYSLYHYHLNGMVLNLLTGGALLENLSFSFAMWLSILGVLLITLLLEFIATNFSVKYATHTKSRTGKYLANGFLAMCVIQILNGCADAFAWKDITTQNRYIPWMQAATMRTQISFLGFTITNEKKDSLQQEQASLQYPLEPLHCTTQTPPNIVMLVVDSLRADMLTAEIMPHTFALTDQAMVFNNHFSSGNSTRYGIFGLMYGISGTYWKSMLLDEKGSVLFDVTQSMNYQHFIYGSATLTFPEFDRTVFSTIRHQLHAGSSKSSASNDQEITERLIKDIDNADINKPFFGFAFYDAPHAFSLPKNYPQPFKPMLDQVNYMELNNNYDPTPFLNRYKTTAYFVDELIAKVHQELINKNLMDNTIVIITSDHGQEFNETKQNYWGHNGNFSQWQTKVPLVILWPHQKPVALNDLTSHEDVVPTLLKHALGCDTPIEKFSTGLDLFGDLRKSRSLLIESWSERAIKYENHLYLYNNLGYSSTVNENYVPQENQTIPAAILQTHLKSMSQFTK